MASESKNDGVPSMIEATIGVGMTMGSSDTPAAGAGSIEDVTAALTDALRAPQPSVVRTAADDAIAFVQRSDAISSATKPQLQAFLRVLLSTITGPSRTFHAVTKVGANRIAHVLCRIPPLSRLFS